MGAVDETLNAGFSQKRDMDQGRFQHLGNIIDGIREELMGEVFRRTILKSRTPRMAVGPEEKPCTFPAQVKAKVGVADQGKEALVFF